MNFKSLGPASSLRSFALIFSTGDEVKSLLEDFARQHHLSAAHFTAIGAFSHCTLAFFDWQSKQYKPIDFPSQMEVLSLTGDISLKPDGSPTLHAHAILGSPSGTAHGGHLLSAHVRPTLELILEESPSHLRRTLDPESGLPLINLNRS